jgi:hypothetical protein
MRILAPILKNIYAGCIHARPDECVDQVADSTTEVEYRRSFFQPSPENLRRHARKETSGLPGVLTRLWRPFRDFALNCGSSVDVFGVGHLSLRLGNHRSKGTFPFEKRLLTWLQLLAKNAAHGVPIIVFPSLRSQQAKKKPGR